MSLRSGGCQFELLADGLSLRSLPEITSDGQRRRRRRSKRKRGFRSPLIEEEEPREDNSDAVAGFKITDLRSMVEKVCESSEVERSASCVTYVGVELRQRSVSGNGRMVAASAEDATSSCGSSTQESATAATTVAEVTAVAWRPEANGGVKKLEKEESLDWENIMKENINILGEVERLDNSPFRYFLGELYGGNALRSTISVGNEKKRQRVYNTMFHVLRRL